MEVGERIESRDQAFEARKKRYLDGTGTREYRLPFSVLEHWSNSPVTFFLVCFGGCAAIWHALHHGLFAVFGPIGLAIVVAYIATFSFLASRARLVVRPDGLLLGKRFFPYSKITDVSHHPVRRRITNAHHAPDAELGLSEKHFHQWVLLVGLTGSEFVRLRSVWMYDESRDIEGADIAVEIEAARLAWMERQAGLTGAEALVARGERTAPEWLRGLRKLATRITAAYRDVPLDPAELTELLEREAARPSARAAAALVLRACGDRKADEKLRVLAAAADTPPLRIALQKIADSRDDEAVAEALAELEEAEIAAAEAASPR